MTEYLYETEEEDSEPIPAAVLPHRIRFDPTKVRGEEYFVRADRHSRLVRWLKIILPATALAGVAGFMVFVQMAPDPEKAVVSLAGVNVEQKSVEMKSPRISGFEGTRRAYEVKAARAVQDLANPKVVRLETITATFGVAEGVKAAVQAAIGVFDSGTKELQLSGGISLKTTNGYTAQLEEASVNIDKGHLLSEKPVEISGAEGTIKANRMEIIDRGARIVFNKGVKLTLNPEDEAASPEAANEPPAKDKKKKAKPDDGST